MDIPKSINVIALPTIKLASAGSSLAKKWRFPMHSLRTVVVVVAVTLGAPAALADVITDWNAQALDTAVKAKWSVTRVVRNMAIVETAVFDAVNAVDHRYKPYLYSTPATTGASPAAAASEAAFKVLAALVPEQSDALAARNTAVLATITDAKSCADGVEAGDRAAAAILANRANDGFDDSTTDQPHYDSLPGQYQPTSTGPLFTQQFPRMRPFGFADPAQFRLPPPAPLESAQYERDLEEVKTLGDSRAHPSDEHVFIARFHAPSGEFPWNNIARQRLAAAKLSLVDEARVLALLEFALSDSFEASFESKNFYHFWRPLTAIQATGEIDWTSVISAPLFAEYPCMHCAVGSAAATVLTRFFPEPFSFSVTSQDGRSRHLESFAAYADEEAESRILGGVHFRWSVVAGNAQGREVALYDMHLLPKE